MKLYLSTVAALCLAGLGGAPVQATTAIDYNVVVRGNFTAPSSDTEGRMAAGGNITVGSYDIGLKASGGGYVAVAGGTFDATGGGTAHGNVLASNYAGNAAPGHYGFTVDGAKDDYAGGTTSPIDIAAEMARLGSLSQSLAASPSTYGAAGTVVASGNNLSFQGSSGTVNIFTLSAAALASATELDFAIPTGAVAVINVGGLSDSIANTGGTNYYGNGANILFNFYQATSLTVASSNGTILAPYAAINAPGGAINGQVFADSWSGTTQINSVNFSNMQLLGTSFPSSSAVPEPASWLMMLIGFGAVGFFGRGHRRGAPRDGRFGSLPSRPQAKAKTVVS